MASLPSLVGSVADTVAAMHVTSRQRSKRWAISWRPVTCDCHRTPPHIPR